LRRRGQRMQRVGVGVGVGVWVREKGERERERERESKQRTVDGAEPRLGVRPVVEPDHVQLEVEPRLERLAVQLARVVAPGGAARVELWERNTP